MNTAKRLADSFYTAENGALCTNDDTARDMVRDADMAGGLGWDFAYEAVRDGLQWLADTEEDPTDDDTAYKAAESLVDVYTADLVAWLASAPIKHASLIDEAMEEYGAEEWTSMEGVIRRGQYLAYCEAMRAIARNWPDDTEEDEEEGDEA